jgi:hypothetical protein
VLPLLSPPRPPLPLPLSLPLPLLMWQRSGRARARPDPHAASGHGSRCHEAAAPPSPTRLCDVLRPSRHTALHPLPLSAQAAQGDGAPALARASGGGAEPRRDQIQVMGSLPSSSSPSIVYHAQGERAHLSQLPPLLLSPARADLGEGGLSPLLLLSFPHRHRRPASVCVSRPSLLGRSKASMTGSGRPAI